MLSRRLEQYTLKRPQEVLLISAEIEGEADQILVFKGFSSSLMRSTAFNPDIPVLPETAKITGCDRLKSPYTPENPQYIQQGLTLDNLEALFAEVEV
ncbi:hypothetical protein PMG71_07005 [Roseofilum sp. BLCC_M154]|uniref:DUF7734 domain-containing protein n=1 Tax=Roseofilum acuticapitatum BLCC-M154 TaxID=3022444 RepID=A0ABT7AQI8_9CYAN|nr:hypothetical protein [Roseofilum acuticapitatum]MDJ1169169.1 hypothetical protein [Roseofilum acuticapitatum BLCC-M154]